MLLIVGLVIVLSVFIAVATPFASENAARGYYNKLVNSPRFIDVQIYDIVSRLDGTDYEVYWQLKVYDNAAKAGNITFETTATTVISKSLTPAQMQSVIESEARAKVNAWEPPKPMIRYADHPLYGKLIRLVG